MAQRSRGFQGPVVAALEAMGLLIKGLSRGQAAVFLQQSKHKASIPVVQGQLHARNSACGG